MKSWKARLLVAFMLVAMLLATVAGPALANDGDRGDGFNGRGDRNDNRQDRNDNNRSHNDGFFFVNSFNNDFFDDNEFFFDDDDFFDDEFFLSPFFFGDADVEFFCDDDDDDFDGFVECDDLFAVVEFDD